MTAGPDRARTLRRRHMHERQAVIFGVLLAGLALAALASAAVYTGAVKLPFLGREFSSPAPAAAAGAPPCPPKGAAPVPYDQIKVNVLNGANRVGLAAQTATALTARGFVIGTKGDSLVAVTATARLTFGVAGVAAAYTLAAQVDKPVLVVDARADATVDFAVGAAYTGLVADSLVALNPAEAFAPLAGCRPIDQITPVPVVSATPDPTPTATVPAG